MEGSPSGGVDQPSEKNAKLFAFVGIFSHLSKVNTGTNIQTDGEALKGRLIFTLLEQFHLDLFKNIHLKIHVKNTNSLALGSIDLRYKHALNYLLFLFCFVF